MKKDSETSVLNVLKFVSALNMHNAAYVKPFEISISYNSGMASLPLIILLY